MPTWKGFRYHKNGAHTRPQGCPTGHGVLGFPQSLRVVPRGARVTTLQATKERQPLRVVDGGTRGI
jgi:hypothetical protein